MYHCNKLLIITITILIILKVNIIKATILLRDVGTPSSYNWDSIISQTSDKDYKAILQVFKDYKIPSASIGIQCNPDPNYVSQVAPTTWRNPQYWVGAGYGTGYWDATMRGASITKPFTQGIWQNIACKDFGDLESCLNLSFYRLWKTYVNSNLAEPKDIRVKDIKIKHLLEHKSGFSNTIFGFDPAFEGEYVYDQINDIIKNYNLASTPGSTYSYSNFGYMILARLAEGMKNGIYHVNLVRELFPNSATIPIYSGTDTVQRSKEVSIYYLQDPDGFFSIDEMVGAGNIVTNAITWSWYATQYWIGVSDSINGKKISENPCPSCVGIIRNHWGSMPGTNALLLQYSNSKNLTSAICILVNSRAENWSSFLSSLHTAAANLLRNKFS